MGSSCPCCLGAVSALVRCENAENAENEITQTVATATASTLRQQQPHSSSSSSSPVHALYYREMFRNLKQVDLIRVHTQPQSLHWYWCRQRGGKGGMGRCYTLSISLYQLCRSKWQHAQRVVPQKMATGIVGKIKIKVG